MSTSEATAARQATAARGGGARSGHSRRPLRSPWAYAFVLPALAIFAVFTIFPTFFTFFISTFKWNYLNVEQSQFIGLKNYHDMIGKNHSPSFLSTMGTSFYFVIAMVVVGTVLALALAMLTRRATKVLVGVRTSLFLAHVAPFVATSLVWIWIFNPRFGLANFIPWVLEKLHIMNTASVDWLHNSATAMPSVIVYSLWHDLGFTTIVFIGGLTTISKDLSEAARLDGCNPWQEFFNVTLPQLRPFVVFVIVIGSISSLHAFTQFFMLTGGGPGYSTATLGFQLYQEAFVFHDTGYAAALAVVLFLITVVLSALQIRASRSVGRDATAQ